MRTRTAAVVAILAVAGLVLSIAMVWPRLTPGPTVREGEPGPPVAAAREEPLDRAPTSKVRRQPASLTAQTRSSSVAPVRVTMGSIDIDARVTPVGVTSRGLMELPPDPRVMGWYEFGAAPGSGTGSIVLAGHLDSLRFGVGPLVRLREIALGDVVEVGRSDGTTSTFRVDRVERFDQEGLPDEVFSRTGPERLRIITCAGAFDPATGYEENLVVTATPA